MNYKLTQDELSRMTYIHKFDAQYGLIRYYDKMMSFQVGDFLVKKFVTDDNSYQVEKLSQISNIPRRYVVVYKDEYGVPFVKPLLMDGTGLSKDFISAATINHNWATLEIDPQFVEHTLMGGTSDDYLPYVHLSEEKAQQKNAKELNSRLGRKLKNEAQAKQFLHELRVGDKIWMYESGMHNNPYSSYYEVTEIDTHAPKFKVVLRNTSGGYRDSKNAKDFIGITIFTTRPAE